MPLRRYGQERAQASGYGCAGGHDGTVTNLELALIPALSALGGVALGIGGNAWLDRIRDHRAVRQQRDRAMAELLAATDDLMSNVHTARGIYGRRSSDRRLVGTLLAVAGTALAGEEGRISRPFLSWCMAIPLLEGLPAVWRGEVDHQRTVALSLVGMVQTRATRFYAAAAALTPDREDELAAAVRDLTAAVTRLLDAIADRDRNYAMARSRAQKAFGRFRQIAAARQTL